MFSHFTLLLIYHLDHHVITQIIFHHPLLSTLPCQSCLCRALEEMWSLRYPVEGSVAVYQYLPSFQRPSSLVVHLCSARTKTLLWLNWLICVKLFDPFWKPLSLHTTELRLDSPPACSPISASLLANSTLLTPQFGATFPLQRMWTFILQTEERNHRQIALSILRTMQDKLEHLRSWEMNIDMLLTFAVEPLPDYPPQQWATVVTESGWFVVVDVELVRDVDAKTLVYRL